MPLPAGLRLGPDFEEAYDVLEVLGEGGMGVVVKARQRSLDRLVAIKFLRASLSSMDSDALGRFEDEARLTAQLTHPNVVQVYGTDSSGDHVYIVYEFVEGESLRRRLKREGRIRADEAFRICVEACRGLQHAHEQGILHRDVKPDNLLLTPDGTVKVADFGLAKNPEAGADRTQGGVIMGTPEYLAPERINESSPGPPSDLYAMGIVLFECLTGRPPFMGGDMAILLKHVNDPAPLLSNDELSFPPEVEAIVEAALRKKAEDRPSTTRWIEALVRGREKLPTWQRRAKKRRKHSPDSPRVTARKEAMAQVPTALLSARRPMPSKASRSRWRSWLLWGLPALVGLLALALALHRNMGPAVETPYAYGKLQLVYRPGEVSISFSSERPYPTAIHLSPSGPTLIATGPPEGSCEHGIRISGLKGDESYRWEILYPDGKRSLPLTLDLHPRIHDVKTRLRGPRSCTLSWRVYRPGRCRLQLRSGKSSPWKDHGVHEVERSDQAFEVQLKEIELMTGLEFRFVLEEKQAVHHGAPEALRFDTMLGDEVKGLEILHQVRTLLRRDAFDDRNLRAPLLTASDPALMACLGRIESVATPLRAYFADPTRSPMERLSLFARLQEVAALEQWTNRPALRTRLRGLTPLASGLLSSRRLEEGEWQKVVPQAQALWDGGFAGTLFMPLNQGDRRRTENQAFVLTWFANHSIVRPGEIVTEKKLPLPERPREARQFRVLLRTVNLYYGTMLCISLGRKPCFLLSNPSQPSHMTNFADMASRPEGIRPDGTRTLEVYMEPQFWELRLPVNLLDAEGKQLTVHSLCGSPYEKRFMLLSRIDLLWD